MLKPKEALQKTARGAVAVSLAAVCGLGLAGCDLSESDMQNMTEADVKAAIEGFFDDLQSGALFADLQASASSSSTSSSSSSSDSTTSGVAATVNGTDISQQEVTNYIQDFREYSGLTDDATFASWLLSYGYTPEALWQETVDIYINQTLILQAADDLGIKITDSEITDMIDMVKSDMEVTSDEEWNTLLEENGLTEESYREQIKLSLTEEAIMDEVSGTPEVTDDIILSYFQNYDENYLNATSVDEIAQEDIDAAASDLQSYAQSLVYYDYMDAFSAAADIEIGEMPENAPYNIDLSLYEDETSTSDSSTILDLSE